MNALKTKFPDSFYEEAEESILVSAKTKKIRAVVLDLLIEFDRVCRKNGIQYFIDSGTLLGAVRHKGFIPWDNDADVIMLRSEYEKICKIAELEFRHPYFFQTNDNDPGSLRGHAQLRNSLTTGILKAEMRNGKALFSFNQGIFLDVLVLDAIPDDEKELVDFRRQLLQGKRKINKAKLASVERPKFNWLFSPSRTKLFCLWCRFARKVFHLDLATKAYKHFEKLVAKYNGKSARRVANFSLNPDRPNSQLFDKKIYSETSEYEFEGFKFLGPADYQTVLEGHYGNWHEHVIGGDVHGGMFIDVDKPYTAYLGK
jgi:lipopolysaccharide cholinephosphotransferase